MNRTAIAVAVGLLASLAVGFGLWWFGFYLFPPSPVLDQTPALVHANPGLLPITPLVWQIFGQALGALLGGLLARQLSPQTPWAGWAAGGAAAAVALLLALLFPRPVWFVAVELILSAAAAFAAGWIRLRGGPGRGVPARA